MEVCLASNNVHKLEEIRSMFPDHISLLKLADLPFTGEIPEDHPTIEENSAQKAWYIYDRFHIPTIADDTGLEVYALNGRPGVYSARYAGERASSQENVALLLSELKGVADRSARFKTVITFVLEKRQWQFEGIVEGRITEELRGEGGFGYDPVFQPEEYSLTFAEMPLEEKNKISHRARALEKFSGFIRELSQ